MKYSRTKTGILVTLFFIYCVCVSAVQDPEAIKNNLEIEHLMGKLIPVTNIHFDGSVVYVRYELPMSLDAEAPANDTMYILGYLAREYPESEDIKIDYVAFEETYLRVSAKTADLRSYVDEEIGDDEITERIVTQEKPACSVANYDMCESEETCEGIGLYWYDGLCNTAEKEEGFLELIIGFLRSIISGILGMLGIS